MPPDPWHWEDKTTMQQFRYLTQEWAVEVQRRLQSELTPDKMKHITSSMLTVYNACPDGKTRGVFYRMEDGVVTELSVREGVLPDAEFTISGDYETFARISRAEIGSRSALMSGKLKLRGNMVKALSLAAVVDRLNKVMSTVPTQF
jgi:putative sterol carrier protein